MNHYETIKKAIEIIIDKKADDSSIDELAKALHMSSSHLRKVFVAWVGITPKQFSRYVSLGYAKALLEQHKNSLQTTVLTGLSSGGRLHDLFVDIEAMTPGEYQKYGAHLTIRYTTFATAFGKCLVAATDRGVCNIIFFDNEEQALHDLQSRWKKAKIIRAASPHFTAVKNYFSGSGALSKIKLHVHGTNFQIKVWEALLSIPDGGVISYGAIAKNFGHTGSAQAIGGAVGGNPIAFIIPCHRVLKSTGAISGYRWGVERKRVMLAYEALTFEQNPFPVNRKNQNNIDCQ